MVLSTVNNFESVPMPDLLSELTGRTGKITLGFRDKTSDSTKYRARASSQRIEVEADDKENVEEDLDLTGSPLGADFDLHQEWDVSCPTVEAVGEKQARRDLVNIIIITLINIFRLEVRSTAE